MNEELIRQRAEFSGTEHLERYGQCKCGRRYSGTWWCELYAKHFEHNKISKQIFCSYDCLVDYILETNGRITIYRSD